MLALKQNALVALVVFNKNENLLFRIWHRVRGESSAMPAMSTLMTCSIHLSQLTRFDFRPAFIAEDLR
jgi:hypothetical protein